MTKRRPQHPSGRPIRKIEPVKLGYTRRPFDEPLTPGLRRDDRRTNAIGFTARILSDDDE